MYCTNFEQRNQTNFIAPISNLHVFTLLTIPPWCQRRASHGFPHCHPFFFLEFHPNSSLSFFPTIYKSLFPCCHFCRLTVYIFTVMLIRKRRLCKIEWILAPFLTYIVTCHCTSQLMFEIDEVTKKKTTNNILYICAMIANCKITCIAG